MGLSIFLQDFYIFIMSYKPKKKHLFERMKKHFGVDQNYIEQLNQIPLN